MGGFIQADDVTLRFVSFFLGAATGYAIAALTLAWGRIILASDMREVLVPVCLAFCLQWIPFIFLEMIGVTVKVLFALGFPLLSCYCLIKYSDDVSDSDGLPWHHDDGKKPKDNSSSSIVRRLGAASFCFAFVIQCVWTSHIGIVTEPLDVSLFWIVFLFVFIATSAVMAVILMLLSRVQSYRIEFFYRVSFILSVVGSSMLVLSSRFALFPYTAIYVAYALITPTIWMLSWGVAFTKKVSVKQVVGIVFGLQYLAQLLGFLVIKSLQASFQSDEASFILDVLSLAAVLIIVVAYALIFPERTLLSLSPLLFNLSYETIEQRCTAIAKKYNLTAREKEILVFLARGRDVRFIEEQLFISKNTVNTHRKNLYKKLDIHSQQELLSLIESNID